MAETLVGGLSEPEPATPKVQSIAEQAKSQLEQRANANYPTYEAISFREQVVAGLNYFIKVRHGDSDSDYAHLRVFQALPCYGGGVQLSNYQLGKTKDDPITYF